MGRPTSIDRLLSDDDRPAVIRRMQCLRYTITELHDWIRQQGYEVSRTAVGKMTKRVRESGTASDQFERLESIVERLERVADRLSG